jgi:quinol monooxygenase YgiN
MQNLCHDTACSLPAQEARADEERLLIEVALLSEQARRPEFAIRPTAVSRMSWPPSPCAAAAEHPWWFQTRRGGDAMLIVAGVIQIDSNRSAAAAEAFEQMRVATLNEPGCIEYQAYADRADPGTLFMFEKWKDQAALDAHFASPHMVAFGAALAGLGLRGMDVKKYVVSSEGQVR